MADASSLRLKVRQRYEAVAERAVTLAEVAVAEAAPARSTPSSVGIQTFRRQRISGAPTIVHRLEATSDQSEWTEKGTPPHVIRPRKAGGVLVFPWPKAGGTVFLRYVNHPGNKPRPWFKKTLEREWPALLKRALSQTR